MLFDINLFLRNIRFQPRIGACVLSKNLVELLDFSLAKKELADLDTELLLGLHVKEYARMHFVLLYIVPDNTIDDVSRKVTDSHHTLRAIH